MSVKKTVLEQKTNTELEKHIVPKNRFVPEAIRYAFEILKSRERHFSDDEIKSIEWLITSKEEVVEDRVVHENYIKASDIFLVVRPALAAGSDKKYDAGARKNGFP